MVARASGIKKSNFSASTTIPSAATFDYVYNNTNTKITAANLLSGLGVTGTIVQAGDPTGTAILDITGTVNSIRTVEDGPGILSSVSALNGLKLEHNFVQDAIGVPLTANMTTASPDIASLLPGAGMAIAKVGNEITFTATGTALPSTKAITINTESDFPAAVTGVITLEADTTYIISNSITTANRFVLGNNTTLTSYSLLGPRLTYSGSATMFTGVDVDAVFINFNVTCPTAKFLDMSDTVGGLKRCAVNNVQVASCDTLCDFDSLFALAINNVAAQSVTTDGLVFTGSSSLLISVKDLGIATTNAALVAVDLGTATAQNIDIDNLVLSGVAGTIGIKGATSSANLTATGLGRISTCAFFGGVTPLSGIVIGDDVQWLATGNQSIADTRPDSLSVNTAGTTVTIATVNTPVKIAGTWVDDNSSQFTVDGTGRATYNGSKNLHVPIDAAITAYPVSGSNKDFTVYIAINGTAVATSGTVARASATDKPSIPVLWQHEFTTNDYVEVFLENNTDAIDFTVDRAVLRVN